MEGSRGRKDLLPTLQLLAPGDARVLSTGPSLRRSPAPTGDRTSSSPGMAARPAPQGWTRCVLKLLSNRDTRHGHSKAGERLSSCHFNTPVNQSRWKPYALLGSFHLVARETSFPFKMAGKGLQKPAFNPLFSGAIQGLQQLPSPAASCRTAAWERCRSLTQEQRQCLCQGVQRKSKAA